MTFMSNLDEGIRRGSRRRSMGVGVARGAGYGGPKTCKCPKCGKEVPHVKGQSCIKQKCSECGSMMIRADLK